MSKVCRWPGCGRARWRGPSGDNDRLTMCEEHQREDWRRRKAEKRAADGHERRGYTKRSGESRRRQYGKSAVKRVTVNHQTGTFSITMPLPELRSGASPEKLARLVGVYRARGFRIVVKGGPA